MKSAKLKNFGTYAEAELAKNLLENYGVKAWVQKGDLNVAAEFTSYGETDLWVCEKDFQKAKEILESGFSCEK